MAASVSTTVVESKRKEEWSSDYVFQKMLGLPKDSEEHERELTTHTRDRWYAKMFDIKTIWHLPKKIDYETEFQNVLNVMYEPLAQDLKFILNEMQEKPLRIVEKDALESFYDRYSWFTQHWTRRDFVESAQMYSTNGDKITQTREAADSGLLCFLTLPIRIASRISKTQTIRQNVRNIQALMLCLGFLCQKRQFPILFDVRGGEDVRVLTEAYAFAMRPIMFQWFEDVLNSWGLQITPEGLTYIVETLPDRSRDNPLTRQNMILWQEFSSVKEHVVTLGMLACFSAWMRVHDLSEEQNQEWGTWYLDDAVYAFFIQDPRLQKHDNYKQVLEYVEKCRSNIRNRFSNSVSKALQKNRDDRDLLAKNLKYIKLIS